MTLIILVPDLPAYDGDVDYSAPYITVDPETGKLVTIDPKAQPQPQHTVTDPNSSQTASAVNQTDNNEQSSQLMAQSTPGNTMNQSEGGQMSSVSITFTIIVLVVLSLVAVIITTTRRKKPVTADENNSTSGSESS